MEVGACKRGSSCNFAHSTSELKEMLLGRSLAGEGSGGFYRPMGASKTGIRFAEADDCFDLLICGSKSVHKRDQQKLELVSAWLDSITVLKLDSIPSKHLKTLLDGSWTSVLLPQRQDRFLFFMWLRIQSGLRQCRLVSYPPTDYLLFWNLLVEEICFPGTTFHFETKCDVCEEVYPREIRVSCRALAMNSEGSSKPFWRAF